MAAGAVSLKKPHHIITLRFSEVVNDHANYVKLHDDLPCQAKPNELTQY